MSLIHLESVRKVYPNGFCAVSDLSLSVEEGEFIALLGPSGCGKSTTLRMVAGLEEISQGTLRIGGQVMNDVPPQKRDVAMVFQSYALYPHMTVFENMAFGLRLRKLPESEINARVTAAAESLGITELLTRKPGQMSGGQRQRVAMGRAIVRRPGVFLFDEPLSNLDARLRLQMRIELGRLHQSLGATSLYVTHDQVEAMTLADRIVLLKDGDLQQVGPPMELYERPANVFVAGFIGSPTMNLVDAMISNGLLTLPGVPTAAFSIAGLEHGDGPVTLGVRPHRLSLADPNVDGGFEVSVVEPLGHETVLYCTRGDLSLSVAVEGASAVRVGDTIALSVERAGIHLFDRESGRRL